MQCEENVPDPRVNFIIIFYFALFRTHEQFRLMYGTID